MLTDSLNRDDVIELVSDYIKVGVVSSIDYANGTARVSFEDDGVVSYDYQVLHTNAMRNKDFAMPDVGENVVCLALPNGIADGFILGSIYTSEIPAPESTGDKRTVVFSDGTRISYDRATHELSVKIDGTTIITDRQKVNITTPKEVVINAPTITLNGNVFISGNISSKGNTTTEGSITATGDIVGAGTSLHSHTHRGDSGGITSAPI